MDRWVLKQLRAQILCDLEKLVPTGYFEQNKDILTLSKLFPSNEYLSSELRWGYNAAKLGKEICFENNEAIPPKLVAAAEILMNLGMLASAEACKAACKYLSEKAEANGTNDGNAGAVLKQLTQEGIPVLEQNIIGSLNQYLLYLKPEEAKPFFTLSDGVNLDMKNNQTNNENISKIVENNTNYVLSINAPVDGNVQQGNNNIIDVTSSKSDRKFFKSIIIGIISSVIGGIILYYVIEYIKNKP